LLHKDGAAIRRRDWDRSRALLPRFEKKDTLRVEQLRCAKRAAASSTTATTPNATTSAAGAARPKPADPCHPKPCRALRTAP